MVRGRAMRATKAARIFTHDAGLFANNKIDGEGTWGTFGDEFFSFSQKNMDWKEILGTLGDVRIFVQVGTPNHYIP
jgi:hypothetical protein